MFSQIIIVLIPYTLLAFFKASNEVRQGNSQKLSYWLLPLGSFVYGDALILAPFWLLAAITAWYLSDPTLLALIISVFWFLRSLGETLYWHLEQIVENKRNKPRDLPLGWLYRNEASTYYGMQLLWLCISVITLITTLYFGKNWLM